MKHLLLALCLLPGISSASTFSNEAVPVHVSCVSNLKSAHCVLENKLAKQITCEILVSAVTTHVVLRKRVFQNIQPGYFATVQVLATPGTALKHSTGTALCIL